MKKVFIAVTISSLGFVACANRENKSNNNVPTVPGLIDTVTQVDTVKPPAGTITL